MPRAVWTGTLSFGLVSIPVALVPATQPKDVRFHLFDSHGRRVRYRRFAEDRASGSTDGTGSGSRGPASSAGEVRYEQLVRGYDIEPGRFALLETEEIERVRPSRTSAIDLEDFVELDAIDPVYFEKSYYLAQRREATKPYRLLREALDRSRRVASVASCCARSRTSSLFAPRGGPRPGDSVLRRRGPARSRDRPRNGC